MVGVFIVSGISSAATWFMLTQKQGKEFSWKETLSLTPEQSNKFAQLESDLNSVLKEMDMDEAQNKIFLCSYLDSTEKGSGRMKSIAVKMAESYRKKQEKIATALTALSEILTP